MHGTGMAAEMLRDCLLNLPPVELLGMRLLQDSRLRRF